MRRGLGMAAHPAQGQDEFEDGFLVVHQALPQFGDLAVLFGQRRNHGCKLFAESRGGIQYLAAQTRFQGRGRRGDPPVLRRSLAGGGIPPQVRQLAAQGFHFPGHGVAQGRHLLVALPLHLLEAAFDIGGRGLVLSLDALQIDGKTGFQFAEAGLDIGGGLVLLLDRLQVDGETGFHFGQAGFNSGDGGLILPFEGLQVDGETGFHFGQASFDLFRLLAEARVQRVENGIQNFPAEGSRRGGRRESGLRGSAFGGGHPQFNPLQTAGQTR